MRVTIRASSWTSLLDCPARWESSQISKKFIPARPPTLLGTAIHAGTAVFDQAKLDGSPIRPDDAAGIVVDKLKNPDEPVDWRDEQYLTRSSAERIALKLFSRYCTEISPRFRFIAVEKQCEPLEIDMGDGLIIVLTGSLDRMYEVYTAPVVVSTGIADLKSGACRVNAEGEVSAHTDGPQLGQYELLASRETGKVIDAPAIIAGMNTRGDGHVGTTELHDCRSLLIGSREQPGLLHHAAVMFRSGSFHPNPRSSLCSQKYCGNTNCRFYKKG